MKNEIEVPLYSDAFLIGEAYACNGKWRIEIRYDGDTWSKTMCAAIDDYDTKKEAEKALENEMISALKEIADNCQKELARRRDE